MTAHFYRHEMAIEEHGDSVSCFAQMDHEVSLFRQVRSARTSARICSRGVVLAPRLNPARARLNRDGEDTAVDLAAELFWTPQSMDPWVAKGELSHQLSGRLKIAVKDERTGIMEA